MFKFIRDRQQEISLLRFAKLEAECDKHNIEEAMKLDPIVKANGELHKTKMKQRETIIKGWEKEIKNLRKFFEAHKKSGKLNDYKRYSFRTGVSERKGI